MMLALCLSFVIIAVRSGKSCSYVAIDGVAYPTNDCFYHEEVNPDDPDDTFTFSWTISCIGDSGAVYRYWTDSDSCDGSPDYSQPNDYCTSEADPTTGELCQCYGRGSACDTFTFGISDTGAAECSYEAQERISIVVNECIATGYGSSQRFSCDDTSVIMEEFPSSDDCTGEGSYMEMDYSSITQDQCVYAECSSGTRQKRRCKKPPASLAPIFMDNIQSQHLFVQNLRAQHKAAHHGAIDWNQLPYKPLVWLIFSVVVMVMTSIVCIIRKRAGKYSGYTKI